MCLTCILAVPLLFSLQSRYAACPWLRQPVKRLAATQMADLCGDLWQIVQLTKRAPANMHGTLIKETSFVSHHQQGAL